MPIVENVEEESPDDRAPGLMQSPSPLLRKGSTIYNIPADNTLTHASKQNSPGQTLIVKQQQRPLMVNDGSPSFAN